MAGVKGKSGGARPGAGRKAAPPVLIPAVNAVKVQDVADEPESIRFLRQVVQDVSLDAKIRLDAAKALAPFEAVKKGEIGKKEDRQQAAKKAGAGKFAPATPPKLVAAGGKKL